MSGISEHTKRKWWYRWIRSMNWFSFHYWWFVLLAFVGVIVLFLYFCFEYKQNETCSTKPVHQGLARIEKNLDDCCNCNEELTSYIDKTIEDSIYNNYDCDSETHSGGAGKTINRHDLGDKPGKVTVAFDMYDELDKLEIYLNNQVVASTFDVPNNQNGFVGDDIASGCCGSISFNYTAVGDKFCVIKVFGLDKSSWTYSLSCPY